jgi:hypothetical protein
MIAAIWATIGIIKVVRTPSNDSTKEIIDNAFVWGAVNLCSNILCSVITLPYPNSPPHFYEARQSSGRWWRSGFSFRKSDREYSKWVEGMWCGWRWEPYASVCRFYKGRKTSVDVVKVKKLNDSGMGASAIAKQMGIGRASVYRALG